MKTPAVLLIVILVVTAMVVDGCGPVPAPAPTSEPPTAAPPTETPTQVPTSAPTATPAPRCGKIAAPETAASAGAPGPLAKFEPPDGQSYFGFAYRIWDDSLPMAEKEAWGDTRLFAERICDSVDVELAGKTPTFLKVPNDWKSPDGVPLSFDIALTGIRRIQAALGRSVLPMLEWQSGVPGVPDANVAMTLDIAAGQYDDYIRKYARDVKSYGDPVFIRLLCGEFNGNWWRWCSPAANPDLTREDFVNAWRRVVDIFREEHVTNVAWIWAPVAFPPPPADWGHDPNWQAYYPGDDYVDWVGGDLNDWGRPSWLDPLYAFAVAHAKPFFVVEFGIRHTGTGLNHQQQLNWLKSMFDYFESHPKIKAINYFNYKNIRDPNPRGRNHVFLYDGRVNYVPDVNDLDQRLLAGGEDMRALFAARISNPRYISVVVGAP